jgi:hypothetical protein
MICTQYLDQFHHHSSNSRQQRTFQNQMFQDLACRKGFSAVIPPAHTQDK